MKWIEWHPCRWTFQSQWQIKLPWQLTRTWHNLSGQYCWNILRNIWILKILVCTTSTRKMWDLATYNLHKALPILAYIDKTYKNNIIMFSGSDSSKPITSANIKTPTHSGGNQQWWLKQPYYLPKTLRRWGRQLFWHHKSNWTSQYLFVHIFSIFPFPTFVLINWKLIGTTTLTNLTTLYTYIHRHITYNRYTVFHGIPLQNTKVKSSKTQKNNMDQNHRQLNNSKLAAEIVTDIW